jgi:hypothetical protein
MPDRNKDWSDLDVADLKSCAQRGITLEGASTLLGRDLFEVAQKAEEIGLALQLANREYLPR